MLRVEHDGGLCVGLEGDFSGLTWLSAYDETLKALAKHYAYTNHRGIEWSQLAAKYRKVHLPGHTDFEGHRPWQHLEKRYFEVGDLGFPVFRTMGGIMGMCLCNDRRWPETWRVMGMKAVELVMLGYNTPAANSLSANEPPHVRMMHNHISVQAGCYQNGTWAVSVAKAGHEDGCDLMGGSIIVAPSGEIVAQAHTLADELIVYDCDLDEGRFNKTTIFNFAAHRRPEFYGIITERAGMLEPD